MYVLSIKLIYDKKFMYKSFNEKNDKCLLLMTASIGAVVSKLHKMTKMTNLYYIYTFDKILILFSC